MNLQLVVVPKPPVVSFWFAYLLILFGSIWVLVDRESIHHTRVGLLFLMLAVAIHMSSRASHDHRVYHAIKHVDMLALRAVSHNLIVHGLEKTLDLDEETKDLTRQIMADMEKEEANE